MEQYKFEKGDLELLAMGGLEKEREDFVILYLQSDKNLQEEYADIEEHLHGMAIENGITPPEKIKQGIESHIFSGHESSGFKVIIGSKWFRHAALLLLLGSVAFNLMLLRNNSIKVSAAIETSNAALLASLPFEESNFEDMFQYIESELMKQPCQMDYKATIAFLTSKGLNTTENLSFLNKHNGHCDCEVLMNVSQMFPLDNYKHGSIVPRSHRDGDIKVSLFPISQNASLLSLNLRNGEMFF
jgi:hypothetical protein